MKSAQITLAVLAVVISFGSLVSCSYISARNEFVRQEEGIVAEYKNNQNKLSNHFTKIQEMAQVPEMYRDDLEKVYTGALKGRYGNDGSKAVFQFIQEHNPNFDTSLYKELQIEIASGRNTFMRGQENLLSRCQTKGNFTRSFPNSFWAAWFPASNHNFADICTPVTDAKTDEAFATKRGEPLKLRK